MSFKKVEIELFNGVADNEMELLGNIKYDDLNEDLKGIADRYGLDFARDFMNNYGGLYLYIKQPYKCDNALFPIIKEKVQSGLPLKKISKDLNVSVRFIQSILKS